MIDIHTHAIYGLDDGSKDADHFLDLLRQAAQQNILGVIATPHHANGRYWNPGEQIRKRVRDANDMLQSAGISVTVYPGQEVRLYGDLLHDMLQGTVITLNDSRYLLLELPTNHIPPDTDEMIHELRLLGITPIIAHPERNTEIAQDYDNLRNLISMGALAQVTSHSLVGSFGKKTKQVALDLCKHRMIHFVATDAHHSQIRGINLKAAFDAVVEELGVDYHDYYINNSMAVLNDQPIDVWPIRDRKKRSFFFFKRD